MRPRFAIGRVRWHDRRMTSLVPPPSHRVPPAPRAIVDAAAAGRLFAMLAREQREVAGFAYLARDGRLLGMRHTRSGWVDALDVPVRAVACDALAFGASAVVMAHNHPSGDSTPSAADRDATRLLARALDALEVRLMDHLVVSSGGIASFRALGLL